MDSEDMEESFQNSEDVQNGTFQNLSSQSCTESSPEFPGEVASPQSYKDLLTELMTNLVTDQEYDEEKFSVTLKCLISFIDQSFCTISSLITSASNQEVVDYLSKSSDVLKLFTTYLKTTADTTRMTCANFGSFPVICASILRDVFMHCKDSESCYGVMLSQMESHLKGLYRCCHDLQTIYLDILQRMVFDLQDDRDSNCLVAALKVNMDIGALVVSLDVRTTADQWRSISAICERHCELLPTEVTQHCINTLCGVMGDHVATCSDQVAGINVTDDKALQRLVKMTSFLMKITVKVCQLFRERVCSDYSHLVSFIVAVKRLEVTLNSNTCSDQHSELIRSHVCNVDPLFSVLVDNDRFAAYVLSQTHQPDEDYGNILLLHAIMTSLQHRHEGVIDTWLGTGTDDNIICVLLGLLPKCEKWLYYGLSFNTSLKSVEAPSSGLDEYLLPVAGALVARSSRDQHQAVETALVSTLITTRSEWTALFASDLLVVMSRFSPLEVCVDQICSLLEIHKLNITLSPASVRLSKTIQRLFRALPDEQRLIIHRRTTEDDMRVIGVNNLPQKECRVVSGTIMNELRISFRKIIQGTLDGSEIVSVINKILLASTCTLEQSYEELVQIWLKCYPTSEMAILLERDNTMKGRGWFSQLVRALVELTVTAMRYGVISNKDIIQILEVMSSLSMKSTDDIKLSAVKILIALGRLNVTKDVYTTSLYERVGELFQKLLQDDNEFVRKNALEAFRRFSLMTNREDAILEIIGDNLKVRDQVLNYLKNAETNDLEDLRTVQVEFVHKCDCLGDDNFEMGDVESVFGGFEENDVHMDESKESEVMNEVLCRIETDVGQLLRDRQSLSRQQLDRIKRITVSLTDVCEK